MTQNESGVSITAGMWHDLKNAAFWFAMGAVFSALLIPFVKPYSVQRKPTTRPAQTSTQPIKVEVSHD